MKHILRIRALQQNTNWKKVFDASENEIRDDLYDLCSRVCSVHEDMFSEMYDRLTNIYDFRKQDISDEFKNTEFSEVMKDIILAHKDDVLSVMSEAIAFSEETPFKIMMNCRIRSFIPEDDEVKFSRRMAVTHMRIKSQIGYFLSETVKSFSDSMNNYFNSVVEYIRHIEMTEEVNENNLNQDIIEEIAIEKTRYKKIFDYKKMASLAEENGFIKKSSSGSHDIYEHYKTNKIIVIPAHTLGLGLSIKIQKDIERNAC